ncbi:replication-relaxation family protein [Polaromonas naphthalenivorans]|nr:replication-relaxation family protein [Polaromonas naphthalenivorans]
MKKQPREPSPSPREAQTPFTENALTYPGDAPTDATVDTKAGKLPTIHAGNDTVRPQKTRSLAPVTKENTPPRKVERGLAATISTTKLKQAIWLRTLLTANRFRVIRTIDVAVCCFAERPYKAALTAAQRAMRGLVKADFLKRYRTERHNTIYGLTQHGVDWLDEAGHDASSSVRQVSTMTNPEHRLWAQFWVLACEARGMKAQTEQELLQSLNKGVKPGEALVQGLLTVTTMRGKRASTIQLRPDAVAYEKDGITWLEVDRSKRGSDREASLAALVSSVGRVLKEGSTLRRLVIFCKTERIRKRALAVVNGLALANNPEVLIEGRRHFREVEPGTYAVWTALESKLKDGRTKLVDTLVGHVIVQLLPIWLPKVRIDASNTHSFAGWFGENYLPYRRPKSLGPWSSPFSPFAAPQEIEHSTWPIRPEYDCHLCSEKER